MSLNNLANASNEKREQRIMQTRRLFDLGHIMTVASAQQKFGYSRSTIIKWCRDGNIPLFDTEKQGYVVPLTANNRPKWSK